MKMNRYLALAKKIQEVHQEIMAIAAEEHDILGFDNTFDRMEEYLTKLHTIYGSDASPVPLLAHPTQPAQPAKAGETDQKRIERILTTGSAKEGLTEALYGQAYYLWAATSDPQTLHPSQPPIE